MKKGILIGLAFTMLCVAAVPYGSNLANIYVRLLDGRDTIYDGIGIPPKGWTDQYGGLSERTLIIGNLQTIPVMLRKIETLEKQAKEVDALKARILKLEVRDPNKVDVGDPNEAKK